MSQTRRLGLLLVHGYTGSPYELEQLKQRLAEKYDFLVSLPQLPGHGTTPDDLRQTTADDWLQALRDNYETLVSRTDRAAIIGLSVGGSLALKIASEVKPAALVTIGALARINRESLVRLILKLLRFGGPDVVKPKDGPFADEKIPGYIQRCYQRIPISSLENVLAFLEREITPQNLALITAPTLIIEGSHDPIIAPWSARFFLDSLSSTDKEYIRWQDHYHLIVQGERKMELYDLIGDWLTKKLLK